MLKGLRKLVPGMLRVCQNTLQNHHIRNECVFRRMYPPELREETGFPREEDSHKDFVYILEECTTVTSAGEMELILTTDISELGNEGEIVKVHKAIGRRYLLPLGLAVYTSPENLVKYEEMNKALQHIKKQTKTGQRTKRQLEAMTLPIPMNTDTKWQLTKQHVRIAFRRVGVYLEEDNITLPAEPVTETGDIQVQVEVNKVDNVTVNAKVVHYNKNEEFFPDVEVWKDTSVNILEHIEAAFHRVQAEKHSDSLHHQTLNVSQN